MGIGISIFLMAAGAVLTWGITGDVSGVNIDVIGVILMAVGAIGLLVSSLFFASFAPFRERIVYRDREIEGHDHVHPDHTYRRSA